MTARWVLTVAIELYTVAIVAWVVASWFPNLRSNRPVRFLGAVTRPYLGLFRFIPLTGGMDLSPIPAILLLQLLAGWLGGHAGIGLF